MYRDLQELLTGSASTRAYFTGLPVWLQMELHGENGWIRTAEQLRRHAECRRTEPGRRPFLY